MLYPYETSTREVRNLDGVWKFCPDPEGIGEKEQWQILGLPESIPMPVPSSYNDITTDKAIRDLIGDAWYEKTTIIPKSWLGKRVVLRFGSVTHSGKVWVNGQYLMEHKGGYLPFEQEIQNMVPLGEEVRITVKVNNVLDYQTLPPGEIEILKDEYRYEKPIKIQNYFHDFYNYAGIHRPEKLYTTSSSYVSHITIETNIQENTRF
ncbi:sugar-binding domain-containing protein, partial [Blautia sp.]|uniref:sugar-binding domain-containing protein n=1 Tax=Blautia sp. TaxID=1955243 RepID=UPI002ED09244